jgi:putative transposase
MNQHRRSIRMKCYDYSLAGAYFITIATHQRLCLFGEVANGEIKLNQLGSIAFDQWTRLEKRFLLSDYSIFVIMPNHIHGIINIVRGAGEGFSHERFRIPPLRPYISSNCVPGSLGTIIRAYKASVTYRINAMRGYTYPKVWQRNYYEHIIRNEKEYEDTWKYIEANPDNWMNDQLNTNSSLG